MQIVNNWQFAWDVKAFFSGENKKNYFQKLSAEIFPQHVKHYQILCPKKIFFHSMTDFVCFVFFSDEEEYDSAGEKVYEDLSDFSSGSTPSEGNVGHEDKCQKKLSTLEMFGKKGTVLRALWAEMPEVNLKKKKTKSFSYITAPLYLPTNNTYEKSLIPGRIFRRDF